MNPIEPPPGCQEVPGFILTIPCGWLKKDGTPTDKWTERGIWPTVEAAETFRLSLP